MNKIPFHIIVLCVLCGASKEAYSAGAYLPEQGAGASAMGGAATARADLPEAAYYNPAALRPSTSWQLRSAFGIAHLRPRLEHRSQDGTAAMSSSNATIPRAHLSMGKGRVGVSASFLAPFGSSVNWPQGWTGRYELQESSLGVTEANLNASVALFSGRLSLAAGLRGQRATLGIERAIDVVSQDATVQISADAQALGVNLAAYYEPLEWLALGVSVRPGTTLRFTGEADFRGVPEELAESAVDTKVREAVVELPMRAALGASARIGEHSVVQADVVYFGWQSTDAFRVDFEDAAVQDIEQERAWRPSFTLRAGYEHRLFDALALRAGGFIDDTPVPARTLSASSPDGLRLGGSVGAGWTSPPGVTVQTSVTWTSIGRREVRNPNVTQGSYGGSLTALSVDVGYEIGR